VSKDIPNYAIAVGNPAKIVGNRNENIFEKLYLEDEPFIYKKLNHKKEIRQK
jgi:serine acetyltransferase